MGKSNFCFPKYILCYAERIISNNTRWAVLVEVRVKPNSYTAHNSTIWRNQKIDNEPTQVEYRIESNANDDLIYRVESENNIFIVSISFVLVQFLENVKDFYEGNIMINSKEERMLLD